MADVKEVRLSKMSDIEAEEVFQKRRLEIMSKMKGNTEKLPVDKPVKPLRLKTLEFDIV